MPNVETVTGPIDADELGTTLIHEHLVFRDEAVLAEWPHAGTVKESEPPVNVDEEGAFEAALESARAVVEHGVKTIAEPTAMFGGRDVRFSRRVAEETGHLRLPPALLHVSRRGRDGGPVRPRHRGGDPGH